MRKSEWNDYRIRCEGPRIQIWRNGTQAVDYTEPDGQIPQSGVIGLPVHGMGKTEASYRDMLLEELPQPYGSMSEGGRLRGLALGPSYSCTLIRRTLT